MPDEIDSCKPWLEKQIDIIKPRIICTMGRHSTSTILGFKVSITAVRGKIHFIDGMKILPTLHPAALLYHREWRKNVVEDFKLLAKLRKDRKS
jgi:DNA polymerase